MTTLDLVGGCLCGEVRFRVQGPLESSNYCHCRMCRKASGAPVAAFATVPAAAFAYTAGTPQRYDSSARAYREFCPRCGSQLTWRENLPGASVDISISALDDPGPVPPAAHLWRDSRIPWFETTDPLPRYRQDRSGGVE